MPGIRAAAGTALALAFLTASAAAHEADDYDRYELGPPVGTYACAPAGGLTPAPRRLIVTHDGAYRVGHASGALTTDLTGTLSFAGGPLDGRTADLRPDQDGGWLIAFPGSRCRLRGAQ